MGLISWVKDVFDANSEEDRRKRVARGDAEWYADYQKQKGNSRVSNNPWQRAVNTTKATVDNASKAYDTLNIFDNGLSYKTRKVDPNAVMSTGEQFRDLLDSDTKKDQYNRYKKTYAPWKIPQSYEEQQKQMGNMRPFVNPAQQIVGNSARYLNTVGQVPAEVIDTTRLGVAQLTNNQEASKAINNQILTRQNQFYDPKSGLLNAGTWYDNAEQARQSTTADSFKRGGLTMLGTVGEVFPVGKGVNLTKAAAQGAKVGVPQILKVAGQGAAANAAAEAGNMQMQYGRVDPLALGVAAAAGGVMSVAPPLAYTGVRRAAPKATANAEKFVDDAAKEVTKAVQGARNAVKNAAKSTKEVVDPTISQRRINAAIKTNQRVIDDGRAYINRLRKLLDSKDLPKSQRQAIEREIVKRSKEVATAGQNIVKLQRQFEATKSRQILNSQSGFVGNNDPTQPTIKNILGEDVPNPAYKAPKVEAPQATVAPVRKPGPKAKAKFNSAEEFYLDDINKVYKKHKAELKDIDDPHRAKRQIINKHFNELDPETQRYLEFEARGTDFENPSNSSYRGFANTDGDGVHASQIYELEQVVDEIQSSDLYNQAHTQPTPKVEAPQVTKAIDPEMQEVIDAAQRSLDDGDIDMARQLADTLPDDQRTLIMAKADEVQEAYEQKVLADIHEELAMESTSRAGTESADIAYVNAAKKLVDHLKAPKSKYKFTGFKRTYQNADKTKSITVGGRLEEALDRLFFATDEVAFNRNIEVLSDKFGGVFRNIKESIDAGVFDDGDYTKFIGELQNGIRKRANNGTRARKNIQTSTVRAGKTKTASPTVAKDIPAATTTRTQELVDPRAIEANTPVAVDTGNIQGAIRKDGAVQKTGIRQQKVQPKQSKLQKQSSKVSKTSSDEIIPPINQYIKNQVDAQNIKPEKTGRIQSLKRTWIDSLAPAEDTFRKAVKDGKISQETLDDIIVKDGKSLRANTMANLELKDSGLIDILHKSSKQEYDELGQTLIAIHSKDLAKNGIETGRSAAIDDKLIKEFGSKYANKIKQFRKASEQVLDKSVDYELISKETAEMLKKKYPNYVPMNRVIEELEHSGQFNGKSIANLSRQTVVQKIKGSKRVVENPLESMIGKVQDMAKQGQRNQAALAWVDALKQTGNARLIKGNIPKGAATMSVLRKGVKEVYEVDPVMEAAAKALTKEQMGVITNAARKVSRVFKTGTTGINLPFIATNLARDQQSALLNATGAEGKILRSIPEAIMETLGHKDVYNEAVRQGAISTSFDLTKPTLKRTAEQIRKHGSNLGTFDKIENVIGRSEEYTRLQHYMGTKDYWLKKGLTEKQAVNKATIAAQQHSADFARSGDLGQVLNAWLPYTNATAQGTRATLRAATKNPARYALKATAILGMPMVMTALWNMSDDNRKAIYDDISEFDKQANFIIVTPWAEKNEEGKWQGIVKIPKPPGVSALMYPIEKGIGGMQDLDPVGFEDVVSGILGFASPLGDNAKSAISTITPQVIKPAVETTLNKNLFTGRDVVPYWLGDKPASEQAYKNTSGTARGVGSVLNTSPLNVEHWVRGYAGEVGLQGLNLADNVLNKAGVIPEEQIGGRSVQEGFTRRFTEAYDRPDSTIEKGSTGGSITATAQNKQPGDLKTVADKTERDISGNIVSRDKYDAMLDAYSKDKAGNLKISSYDSKDLVKANREIGKELNSELSKLGLPQIKTDSTTAQIWAKYKVSERDGKIGELEKDSKQRSVFKNIYRSRVSKTANEFFGISSDAEMERIIESGKVSKEQLDEAIALDNFLTESGLQSYYQIGKELRAKLGYGSPSSSKSSRSGGSSGGRSTGLTQAELNKYLSAASKTANVDIPQFATSAPRQLARPQITQIQRRGSTSRSSAAPRVSIRKGIRLA